MSTHAPIGGDPALVRTRLVLQGLGRPLEDSPAGIVRSLLAVQSQDYLGGKWSVAWRIAGGVTDAMIERELDAGRILRTHVLRPTWHFVLPEDIRWLLAATSPRVLQQNGPMARKLSLDARTLAKALAVIARELEGRRWRTREELGDALAREGVRPATGQRLAYVVMQAELEGLIASGPRRGKQFTYGLLDERAPRATDGDRVALPREEGLMRLAWRYYRGHGPASPRDLARWASLTISDAVTASELAAEAHDDLVVHRHGREAWFAPKGAIDAAGRGPAKVRRRAHLLSVFDEYVNGYRDRSMIISDAHARAVTGAGNALLHVFLIDGRVRGSWTREFTADEVRIKLRPFDRTTRDERSALHDALARAAKAYGRFVGLAPRWV